MAPAYKLTYFDGPFLAEPIRFLFSYGNIDFEDDRVGFEQWATLKEKTPFGQLPLLEHNGKIANQSLAICRYVAKLVKLTGSNDWEDLEIDAVVDTINDIRLKFIQVHHSKVDDAEKEALRKPLLEEYLPNMLKKLDANAKGGYLANGKLSWADVYLIALADTFKMLLKGDFDFSKYANLKSVKEHVLEQPGVKAWIAKRPAFTPPNRK